MNAKFDVGKLEDKDISCEICAITEKSVGIHDYLKNVINPG